VLHLQENRLRGTIAPNSWCRRIGRNNPYVLFSDNLGIVCCVAMYFICIDYWINNYIGPEEEALGWD
jgi:hypothetical protein